MNGYLAVLGSTSDTALNLQRLSQRREVLLGADESFYKGDLLAGVTPSLCFAGSRVTASAAAPSSYSKSGLVENTTPSLFFQSLSAIWT